MCRRVQVHHILQKVAATDKASCFLAGIGSNRWRDDLVEACRNDLAVLILHNVAVALQNSRLLSLLTLLSGFPRAYLRKPLAMMLSWETSLQPVTLGLCQL